MAKPARNSPPGQSDRLGPDVGLRPRSAELQIEVASRLQEDLQEREGSARQL